MVMHNSDRMPVPLKNLNAFNLPKLKKFPVRAEAKAVSSQTAEEAENIENAIDVDPANAASPVVDGKYNPEPASKPTTVRKSRRQAKPRPSEVTVYYDAVQSPDDVGTVNKQRPRQARAGKITVKPVSPVTVQDATQIDAVADTHHFDTQPEPMEADDEAPSLHLSEATQIAAAAHAPNPSRRSQQQIDVVLEDDAPSRAAATSNFNTRRSSKTNGKASSDLTIPAGRSSSLDDQQQQPQHPGKATECLRDGQEIFKYMQQLAENAAELLPQDDEQKKRGRGRAKKDLRLVDALHQSWKGKSYYERLQELTRQEVQEEHGQAGAGPEYRPMQLSAPTAAAHDHTRPDSSKRLGSSQQQQQAGDTAPGRKRRTTRPSSRAGTADSDTEMGADWGNVAEEAEDGSAQIGAPAATSGGFSKRRATTGSSAAVGREAAAAAKASKPAVAAAAAANNRRKSTVLGAIAGSSKSPFPSNATTGVRPLSSKAKGGLTWESTPAGTAAGANLAERPPWSVGGSAAAGVTGTAGAAKADRSAVQRLQAVLDAKTDDLAALKEQLKESQDLVAKLRADQKAHPKALALLEKQKHALEKKVEAAERRQTALERENEALQENLAKQEAEKAALQEQLSKSEKELKAVRLKLRQSTAKLEKCQAMGQKLQEMGAALAAEAQPIWMD